MTTEPWFGNIKTLKIGKPRVFESALLRLGMELPCIFLLSSLGKRMLQTNADSLLWMMQETRHSTYLRDRIAIWWYTNASMPLPIAHDSHCFEVDLVAFLRLTVFYVGNSSESCPRSVPRFTLSRTWGSLDAGILSERLYRHAKETRLHFPVFSRIV